MGRYHREQRDGSKSKTIYLRFQYKGVRVDRDTGETTVAGARRKEKQWRQEIDQAVASQPSIASLKRMTVGTALARYWTEHLQFKKGASRKELPRLNKIGATIGTDVKLEDLSTALVKAAAARLLASGINAQTVNRDMRPLKAMHNMARDVWEYPNLRTIAWKKTKVAGPIRVIKAPTVEEIRLLVDNATERLGKVIMFAALTGFRLEEIRNLQWDDLAITEHPATVRSIGKGDKEVMLPLSSAATSLILSIPPGQSSRVFDMTNFVREWNDAKMRAGLAHTRFHDLKHAFATLFRATTKDPLALKDALRHSDINTSLGYAHADNAHLLPSLEAVAQKLLGSQTTSNNLSETENDEPDLESFG